MTTSTPFTNIEQITVREICKEDDPFIANIIRSTLEEFSANHPGTVYYDATTDALFELFSSTPGSKYFVAVQDGRPVGGGGIFPTEGLPAGTCELVKMYLLPEVRGLGLGRRLIIKCLAVAEEMGYRSVYLETMPELKLALKAYEKLGFRYIKHSMGKSGHFGCDLFMLKEVGQEASNNSAS